MVSLSGRRPRPPPGEGCVGRGPGGHSRCWWQPAAPGGHWCVPAPPPPRPGHPSLTATSTGTAGGQMGTRVQDSGPRALPAVSGRDGEGRTRLASAGHGGSFNGAGPPHRPRRRPGLFRVAHVIPPAEMQGRPAGRELRVPPGAPRQVPAGREPPGPAVVPASCVRGSAATPWRPGPRPRSSGPGLRCCRSLGGRGRGWGPGRQ